MTYPLPGTMASGSGRSVPLALNMTSAPSTSLTGRNFGPVAPNRYLIAAIGEDNPFASVSNVAIAGVPATLLFNGSSGNRYRASFWMAHVPNGTSGSISYSGSGAPTTAIYRVAGLISTTPLDVDSNIDGLELDVEIGGAILAIAVRLTSTNPDDSFNWTGVSKDGELGCMSVASSLFPAGAIDHDVMALKQNGLRANVLIGISLN